MRKYFYLASAILTLVSISAFTPGPVKADSCDVSSPQTPQNVWAKSGPGGGQVTLYWNESANADRYALAFGNSSGNYQYGATNIGNGSTTSYTVSGLSSGKKYYFVLTAAKGCNSSPFSSETTAWAASGGESWTGQAVTAVSGNLSAISGPKIGQVTLNWNHKEDVDTYHVVYGTGNGNYQYGALNIGKTTSFTVGSLVAGKSYYFAIVPVKGDRALYTSDSVRVLALAPVEIVTTSSKNIN